MHLNIWKQILIGVAILYGIIWIIGSLAEKNQQFHDIILNYIVPIIAILISLELLLIGLINLNTKIDSLVENFLLKLGFSKGAILRIRGWPDGNLYLRIGGGPYKNRLFGWLMLFEGILVAIGGIYMLLIPNPPII